jgi:steroid delta-isomerase-like uncharacterized protein
MPAPALTQAAAYFEAWNARDAGAVTAALADGGTYADPTTESPLAGPALAEHARALFAAFPDLNFEVVSCQPADAGADGTMVVQWLMRGTNTGPLRGQFPTGRTVALAGVDVITITDGEIRSVEGYFDRQTMAEQLGLQVIVQPYAIGPFEWGYAVRASGDSRKIPGAVSVTWIDTSSAEEADQVREIVRPLAAELAKAPGFISWLGIVSADRMYTLTAWESADAAREITRNHLHQGAVKQFFGERFCTAETTGVWIPHHLNPVRVRCTSCGGLSEVTPETEETRACGQPLPQARW